MDTTASRDGSGRSTCSTPLACQVHVTPGGSQLRSAEPKNDDDSPKSHASDETFTSQNATTPAESAANENEVTTSHRPGYDDTCTRQV